MFIGRFCRIFIVIALIGCKSFPPTDDYKNNAESSVEFLEKEFDPNTLGIRIKTLFNLIEEYIARGDFKGWYNSLSKKYRYFLDKPTNLRKISRESEFLCKKKIVLQTSHDYFNFVVVQSRKGKTLKFIDYTHINKKHIKVISLFDNEFKFLYDFVHEGNSWKLDR